MMINTDIIYPIGSIYMTAAAVNPENLFGGKWIQIKDKFLLSAGDSYEAATTGGEATHTLTTSEMPNHNHGIYSGWSETEGSGDAYRYQTWAPNNRGWHYDNLGTSWSGEGQAHNNMPPYLVVYVWQRIQ